MALLIEAGMACLELCETEFWDFGHSLLMSNAIKAAFYSLLHKLKKMLAILQDSRESGAPNEKIVQNPCNIAFLNVF